MRRFVFFVVLVVVLLVGGGLTSMLISSGGQVLPVLQQVGAADASPTELLPWKANQFFLLIAFVLFNLVGIAITIGALLFLLDWGIKRSKADAKAAESSANANAS
jgi:flagellar basal body-associated protein FliL